MKSSVSNPQLAIFKPVTTNIENKNSMKINFKTPLILIIILTFTSCDFISNTFEYKKTTEKFMESVISENYIKASDYMVINDSLNKIEILSNLKSGLSDFRELVTTDFGTKLEYSFMTAEKTFSTNEDENTPPNSTVVFIQFKNEKEFGMFKILFDDNSGKIINISLRDIKESIPNMTIFWLFGIIAISIPIFNIYVIRKIKKSNLKRKWLKYIYVLIFNVPTVIFKAVGGLSLSLLSFQFLFGLSFNYYGFISAAWEFGIPIGGIYWLWKLNRKQNDLTNEIIETE